MTTPLRSLRFILLAAILLALSFAPLRVATAQEPGITPEVESIFPEGSGGIVVEQALMSELAADSTSGYLIYFSDEPDLTPAYTMDWAARGEFVVQALQETAERSQAEVRAYLDAQGIPYESFWAENVIAVDQSNVSTLNGLMAFDGIESLGARFSVEVGETEVAEVQADAAIEAVQENIGHVGADQVWSSMGIDGTGIVVANIDTGVLYTHEALVSQYRGNLGSGSYSHSYNWLDPVTSSSVPTDTHGHGTHTMGTMVGNNATYQTGMAPGAKWIACAACDSLGSCTDTNVLTCGQWVLAPYPSGTPGSADSSKRPDVVNNSWGKSSTTYDNWYQSTVNAWVAAGIYPVFSQGNCSTCSSEDPAECGSVSNPARYGNVTAVGSTGNHDGAYAYHSVWGPSDVADTLNPREYAYLKPQVVAPGVSIVSAYPGFDPPYAYMTGTSMSAPHVAGLVALIWEAAPCLKGNYAATESIIQRTATGIAFDTGCSVAGPGNVPNCATGWGEIDAVAAVQTAENYCAGFTARSFMPWTARGWLQ